MKWENRLYLIFHLSFFAVLVLVLLGGYFVEFVMKHEPCALCYLQRLGMVLAALCLLINLKKGPSPQSLGVCLLSALFGFLVSIRHNSLKFCCESRIKPVVLGKSLPNWALWVFGASMLAIAVLLMFNEKNIATSKSGRFFRVGFLLISAVLILGIVSTLMTRGFAF